MNATFEMRASRFLARRTPYVGTQYTTCWNILTSRYKI